MRRSKVQTAGQALAQFRDGDSIIVAGVHFNNVPMTLVRELIRRRPKDLELIPTPAAGIWIDMLIAAQAVRKLWVSYVGLDFLGLAPNFRRAVEGKTIEIVDVDEPTIFHGLRASGSGLPFVVFPPIHMLTDLPKVSPQVYREITDPFTGQPVVAVPPLAPDWAFIHVAQADEYGNGVSLGGRHMEDVIAKSAKHVVLSTEEIVPAATITATPTHTTLPGALVESVVLAPYGGYPGTCPGLYGYDRPHLEEYVELAKADRTGEYLERYVYAAPDDDALFAAVGWERLRALHLA